jgi:FMN phosphatase YigB (HAD superfamily)
LAARPERRTAAHPGANGFRLDPACYLLACQALDLPPGQVAMVDDVPEFIAGARAVGMPGVLHRTAQETAAKLSALLPP